MLKVNATGETVIFRNEYDGKSFYNTSLSKKNVNDEWENGSIGVQFKKDVEMHNKTKINITNGWLTFYKTKDEKPKTIPYLFILEFDIVDATGTVSQVPDGFVEVLEDDIPF